MIVWIIRVFKSIFSRIEAFTIKHPYYFIAILSLFTYSLFVSKQYFFSSIYVSLVVLLIATLIIFKNVEGKLDQIRKMTVFIVVLFTSITFVSAAFASLVVPESFHFGSLDAWIGFAGSILGGTITMLALMYTIENEDKQRKNNERQRINEIDEERALIFMPVIDGNLHKDARGHYIVNQECHITINNVSSNILRNFKLINAELIDPIHCEIIKKFELIEVYGSSTNIIVNEYPHSLVIDDGKSFSADENVNKEYREKLILKLDMSYKDITLKNLHFHETKIHLISLQSKEEFTQNGHREFSITNCSNNYLRSEKAI